MKKKHKKSHMSGYQDDMMEMLLDGGLLVAGAVGAQELKAMIPVPTDLTTFYGKNQSYIVNGLGIVLGLAAPMITKDAEVKKYLRPLGFGFAAQCATALYVSKVKSPPVGIAAWNTYALGKGGAKVGLERTYALGGKTNFNVGAFDVNGQPTAPAQPKKNPMVPVPGSKRTVGGL